MMAPLSKHWHSSIANLAARDEVLAVAGWGVSGFGCCTFAIGRSLQLQPQLFDYALYADAGHAPGNALQVAAIASM